MNTDPARARGFLASLDIRAAMLAGMAAAIVATAAQLVLWWAYAFPLPATLFRDARLAAAIVLGRNVLPPPATFDWRIMLVAMGLHFALSIVYAFVLAAAIGRLAARETIATGALFGLALYVVNMYGFTWLFPWFAITRDWITAVAHVAFGIAASASYAAARRQPAA